jgi:rhamnose transport system permease protein
MHDYRRELSVAAAYGVLLLVLALLAPRFFEGQEFLNIAVSNAPILVAAIGMTMVILARHIDISIGLQWSVCAVTAGLLAKAGWPMPLVVIGTLLAGGALGAVNGAFVAGLRLPSIVVTLGTVFILGAALSWGRQGEAVRDIPDGFQWFGRGQAEGQWLIIGIAIAMFAVFAWALRYLAAGRAVYATGSDAKAAFLAGLRPQRVVFGVFVAMGVLSALAALLSAAQQSSIQANTNMGKEIQVIAAVVVGGVAVAGGRGTLVGPFLGVLLLGTIGSALIFLHIEASWEKAIQGMIILVAVSSDALNLRLKRDAGTHFASR